MSAVKSDHCSMRKARMSRTDGANHASFLIANTAWKRFAISSLFVTYTLPWMRSNPNRSSVAAMEAEAIHSNALRRIAVRRLAADRKQQILPRQCNKAEPSRSRRNKKPPLGGGKGYLGVRQLTT